MADSSSRVDIVTDAEKQVLLDRYLDIAWIDNVTEVECVRCHRVPIHHYVSNCLHIFCRNCRNVFSDGGQWQCPSCHTYVTQLSDQEWQLEDRIYQLAAHCPNKKYGCHYKGQLSTIPGHLRHCKDTREAALPAEFKGITLDTVVNQVTRINHTMGDMRSETKLLEDKCETNWNETETIVDGLTDKIKTLTLELNEQKGHLNNVEQLIKDVKELRDSCETNWKQLKENDEELSHDLKMVKWDLQEEKEQFASVKHILKGEKEKESKEANEILKLKSRLEQLETLINTKITQADKQLINFDMSMGAMQNTVKDLKENWETNWDDVKKHMDKVNMDLHEQNQLLVNSKEKESRDAMEMQQLRSQLQQQQTLMTAQFKRMMKRLSGIESKLKGVMDERDDAEMDTQQMANNYEEMLKGLQTKMAQTLMPYEALTAMTLVYEWDIKIKRTDGRFYDRRHSDGFPLTGYHYGAKAKLNTMGFIRLQIIDYNKTEKPIDTKSMPKIMCVLKDQVNSSHKSDIIGVTFIRFKDSLEYEKDIDGWALCLSRSITRPPYVVSNGMHMSVFVEAPSMASTFYSNDGVLLWRLDNYKMRKQMEVDGLIDGQESPYFYTSPLGYRVLFRLYLKDKTVCADVLFLKGEFDACLAQQFAHRLTVTIFNRRAESKNLVHSQENNEADCTGIDFDPASASLFESDGYVKDDSLLIKAVVEHL